MAVARNGKLAFIVGPDSSKQPSCFRRVEVVEEEGEHATLWQESVSYDDACANRFPLLYGAALKGQHQRNSDQISAKPLKRGVVYDVSVTTGATGYGRGRFVIHEGGRLENLKFQTSADEGN
ncbi:hypothetical protein FHR23_001492 [Stakelama sediminis]|uniref:Uncharacterized protein n=1 Tax=Stakelama sediminis TaxID=463200 RepID=A0A840YYG0_9SPHN|nr:hypothetical protein [Stakelama sediminis]